jgi:hypothetical protein
MEGWKGIPVYLLQRVMIYGQLRCMGAPLPSRGIGGNCTLTNQLRVAYKNWWRGNNSVVECNLAKVKVAGSNPVSRSSPFSLSFSNPS